MRRRDFLTGLGGTALPWLRPASAQSSKVYRLGQLAAGTRATRALLLDAFMDGMRELGYVEGKNLLVEHRFGETDFGRLPSLARELLAWQPDALLVSTTPANLAAKGSTSVIPIVMVGVADPVGVGLVQSLSRP